MASYKVPQDVEADDKLIGPFSFRQFIYLIIVALAGAAAWGLAQIFVGLAVIPLPVILLFGALALPLRKDQPMEIYLAAIIQFYLKPRGRLWDPDGIDSFIEITTPKTEDRNLTKGLSQTDASQRISYLANLVDTGGWAIRGAVAPAGSALSNDAFLEAQDAEDILDTNNSVARSINTMMDKRTAEVREEAIERMHQPAPTVAPMPAAYVPEPIPVSAPTPQPNQYVIPEMPVAPVAQTVIAPAQQDTTPVPIFNPYPNSMQQSVIQPMSEQPKAAPAPVTPPVVSEPEKPVEQVLTVQPVPTSKKPTSPDIIRLASNTDLSIQTIAHEAHRIQEKEDEKASDEVVISLR
jgi:hypothetical protein